MSFDPKQYLMDMRGKEYLEVKWRIVWFRDQHPNGAINTEVVSTDPPLIRAIVTNDNGAILGTGHGSANAGGKKTVWSGREFEKAETAAIGRALAHAGFGTQFTGEVEGDEIADAPVERKTSKPAPQTPAPPQQTPPANDAGPGAYFDNPGDLYNTAIEKLGIDGAAVRTVLGNDIAGVIKAKTTQEIGNMLRAAIDAGTIAPKA